MKWKPTPPPNGVYERAVEMFGVSFEEGVAFTYGDTIHSKNEPYADLVAHEEVHERQQLRITPELWWDRFFTSVEFRLDQELEAYRVQFKFIKKHVKDRNRQAKHLDFFAKSLSGTMYGNMISYREASKLIRNGI